MGASKPDICARQKPDICILGLHADFRGWMSSVIAKKIERLIDDQGLQTDL